MAAIFVCRIVYLVVFDGSGDFTGIQTTLEKSTSAGDVCDLIDCDSAVLRRRTDVGPTDQSRDCRILALVGGTFMG